jgi:FKBP-type peptidyl-prolyl cis-trans isomerase FkpA
MLFSSRPARHLALAAGLLSFATLTACNKGGASGEFAKTKSGVEYKIFKNEGGKYTFKEVANGEDPTYKTSRLGKVLAVHMEYRTSGDSILMKSRERQFGMPVRVPLDTIKRMGAEQEAFAMLQPGDSGVFRFNADSLYMRNAHQLAPAYLKKKGNFITLTIKADKLQTREEATTEAQADQQKMMAEQQRKMMAYASEQLKKDDVVLQDYMKKNNLTGMKKTPSGMYYQVTKPGTGPTAKAGQKVSVNYMGMLLTGKMFDSSEKVGKPFEFPLGQGQVIPGWDEGIALLNKGSRAILLIPSTLAYGQRGAGADIPADSPLRFEVELVDIK